MNRFLVVSLALAVGWLTSAAGAGVSVETRPAPDVGSHASDWSGGVSTSRRRLIAVVPSATGPRVTPLDARTLAPVREGWSRLLGTVSDGPDKGEVRAVLSPLGSRVAVTGRGGRILVLDTATGRLVRAYGLWPPDGLWWLGGEGTTRSPRALLIWAEFGCWSLGCGLELEILGRTGLATAGVPGEPVAALAEGLVLVDGVSVSVYGGDVDVGFELRRMPSAAPLRVVADVVHGRLFAISSAGLVALIDNVARRPRITYHRVALNGRPFEAVWAGAGKIALWGQDGLGTIDTRTWSTRAVAPGVTGVVATRFGLAAWTDDPAEGVTLYRPDGRTRLRVLSGKRVRAARVVGGFLYVDADVARYSIELRSGKVAGPLSSNAAIVTPSLVFVP